MKPLRFIGRIARRLARLVRVPNWGPTIIWPDGRIEPLAPPERRRRHG